MRRTSWLQAMSKAPQEHAQVTTAVWGTMLLKSPLDSVGHLKLIRWNVQGDLEETFFEVWKGDRRAMFEAGDTTIEFSLLDPRLLRVAWESSRRTLSEQERCVRISCGLLLWVVVTG